MIHTCVENQLTILADEVHLHKPVNHNFAKYNA